jgi:acyl-coenzyme A thioesterase PaaI-like protein
VLIAPEYNGYPGVAHGGIVAALLDEVSGRAPLVRGHDLDNLFVTVKLEVRYRRPTPTASRSPRSARWSTTTASARVRGELRLPDGTLTAECESLLMRAPEEFRARWAEFRGDWRVYE